MGFTGTETIAMVLVVNLTAAAGAFAFGRVQDRIGHKATIAITLCMWLAMVVVAWLSTTRAGFWVAANLAGLALGASQSAGRALTGLLAPPSRRAEFFGLWGLTTRASAIVGPVAYGAITWVTGNQHRPAMLATGAFFVVGLVLLAPLDVRRGYRAALRADVQARRAAAGAI
jgi:UMF1 family MFS transporter